MISASKTTYSLKILKPKVTKNITNLHNKFCEFPPRCLLYTVEMKFLVLSLKVWPKVPPKFSKNLGKDGHRIQKHQKFINEKMA